MASSPAPQSLTRLGGLLGLLGLLILVDQLTAVIAVLLPLTPDNIQWRYGAYGLVASRATPLMLSVLLLVAGAVLAGGRPSRLVLAVLAALGGLALLGGAGLFALDAVQMHPLLPVAARQGAASAGIRVGILGVLAGAVLLWVAFKLVVFARAESGGPKRGARPLIVSSSEAGE